MTCSAPPCPTIGLTPDLFAKAFPFHLVLDRSMKLLQAGSTLQRVCPDVRPGVDFDRIFRISLPKGPMTLEHILGNQHRIFLMDHHSIGVRLRGEFVQTTDKASLLFLGSPWMTDASEMAGLGLSYKDFAVHDPVVDVLNIFHANKQALADATKLATKLSNERANLRAAISRKKALLRNLHQGVVFEDADQRVVLVNEQYCKFFWLSATPEALLGTGARDLDKRTSALFRDPEGYVDRVLSNLRIRDATLNEECVMRDGTVFERDSLPIVVDGRYAGFLRVYNDVTASRRAPLPLPPKSAPTPARKRAATEMSAEKDLLAATLGSIDDGVITVNASGNVQLINHAAEAMIGNTGADATGRPVHELLHLVDLQKPSEENQLPGFLERQLSSLHGDFRRSTFILKNEACQHRVVAISAHPVLGAKGAGQSGLLIFRDVSKEFETEQMKQDFINSVFHELRTPLTTIRGFIDTLLADAEMPEETRLEFLRIIRLQSGRLSQLVDNILDMSRIDAGAAFYEDAPLQLGTVAESSLAEIRPLADTKGVHLVASIQPELPDFNGDAMRLQSTVTNLLGNAVKFSAEGGLVQLVLGMDKGEIDLSIHDTGPGIAEEHLDRIFEKFYRVPRPGRPITGTGLGLPIAAAIVKHYGGRIKVESQVGKGSCFRIFLPIEHVTPP